MTFNDLEKFLLSFNGVTRFDLPKLNLIRYLVHDMPFAVIEHSPAHGRLLNIRLNRGKIQELAAQYKDAVEESGFYDPSAWITVTWGEGVPEDAHNTMTGEVIFETLRYAYVRLLNSLPAISRAAYLETNPVAYFSDAKKLLKAYDVPPSIDYSKKVELSE